MALMETAPHSFDLSDPTQILDGMEYIQYPSESFLGLPQTSSPRDFSLSLSGGMGEYTYNTNYTTASPGRSYTPTIFPGALTNIPTPGDLSSGESVGPARGRRGSGALSPSPAPVGSLASIPRSHRYNPIATTVPRQSTRQQKKRSKGSDDFDSDDDGDFNPSANMNSNDIRREEIRRQRIESEQRRRDELRDGYRRLKDALPVSNQKSSKVSLLDRATTHIRYLEMTQQQLQTRLAQAEAETARLRHVNEALMLGTAEQRHAAAASAVAAAAASQAPAF